MLFMGITVNYVLIPYQQGGLFRPFTKIGIQQSYSVLIPYQQGGLFRPSCVLR